MFEVTKDDIRSLGDADLRELVGRLCEAELALSGLPPTALTWGGHQDAADGGLDVRVDLPCGSSTNGYIQRPQTGFQVKKHDLSRAGILKEMRPASRIRPVIRQLGSAQGAYIIVCSGASNSDRELGRRRAAMREALQDVPEGDQPHTDFYDCDRLVGWIRRHASVAAWVRSRVGRKLQGWQPHGAWCGGPEGPESEYLMDGEVRLRISAERGCARQPVAAAIDEFRDLLARPGRAVRLVGLSGVGKTRLVEALFDARVGSRPLPRAFAIYTDQGHEPDPAPLAVASNIVLTGERAIMIVDNCTPGLHEQLAALCSRPGSTLSVLTVEYDIQDDQPEFTEVVELEVASEALIERLVERRYSHLSRLDIRAIAMESGGNARIALAIAARVEPGDSVAGLPSQQLFQRLFWQRQQPDDSLRRTALACSLVYSFAAEPGPQQASEIPHLAAVAGQTVEEFWRNLAELKRRGLLQSRSIWRALLPHAIANRLAAEALECTRQSVINREFLSRGTERLARSFSRRLSHLHTSPVAKEIVRHWLAPEGRLGELSSLGELGWAMFANVAPVLPESALAALERAASTPDGTEVLRHHRSLLMKLAFDAALFERSAGILASLALRSQEHDTNDDSERCFVSLFTIVLSGTHATIEQRLQVVEGLLRSENPAAKALGLEAMDKLLQTGPFTGCQTYDFGARPRDYGYQPKSREDSAHWFGSAISCIERLALDEGRSRQELLSLLANDLMRLIVRAPCWDRIEGLCRRVRAGGFWPEGWWACRQALQSIRKQAERRDWQKLSRLVEDMGPASFVERVRGEALSKSYDPWMMEENEDPATTLARVDEEALQLGRELASDGEAFAVLAPELATGGSRGWKLGQGLAVGAQDKRATWEQLVAAFVGADRQRRSTQVLDGYLHGLSKHDESLVNLLLDEASNNVVLHGYLPALQMAVGLDDRGVQRLTRSLRAGSFPVAMCRPLGYGRRTDALSGEVLGSLLSAIAAQPDGPDVALDILHMRIHADLAGGRPVHPVLQECGRSLLVQVDLTRSRRERDYELSEVAKAVLPGTEGAAAAADLARRLKRAVHEREIYSDGVVLSLGVLFSCHPAAALDAIFDGKETDFQLAESLFGGHSEEMGNPSDVLTSAELIDWCNADKEHRYPLAAQFIRYSTGAEGGGQSWTEQAKALLTNAPDRVRVLLTFTRRFQPWSWSGSRGVLIQKKAALLDSLDANVLKELQPHVDSLRKELTQLAKAELEREARSSRQQDETFE